MSITSEIDISSVQLQVLSDVLNVHIFSLMWTQMASRFLAKQYAPKNCSSLYIVYMYTVEIPGCW